MKKGSEHRKSDHPILPAILDRWSPRAMSGEVIDDASLMKLFEAARWAPSSYNAQPWRFVYAHRDSEAWPTFFNLLVPLNQAWAGNAAVLIVAISQRTNSVTGAKSVTHSFDTGMACENLALEGTSDGFVVHMMQGFDYEAAREKLAIPEDYAVEAMIAVGRSGPIDSLPEPLQQREVPSGRAPVADLIHEGKYGGA